MTGRPRTPHGERDKDGGVSSGRRPWASRPVGSVADAERAVAETARAGRASIGTTTPQGQAPAHGGHSGRPRSALDFERQERWANEAYDNIRANPDVDVVASHLSDVPRLDGSTGFSAEEIGRIREHVFFEEHPLSDYDGGIRHRRYDASADMAEAWLRIRSGNPRTEDVALLEHESAEAHYYDTHPGATYEEAHRAANVVSNWQDQIPEPTYEDYSRAWR